MLFSVVSKKTNKWKSSKLIICKWIFVVHILWKISLGMVLFWSILKNYEFKDKLVGN